MMMVNVKKIGRKIFMQAKIRAVVPIKG